MTRGFLGPKVKLADVWDITSVPDPVSGLLVFNTVNSDPDIVSNIADRVIADIYYYWSGEKWVQLADGVNVSQSIELLLVKMRILRPALFMLDGRTYIWPGKWKEMKGVSNLLGGVGPGWAASIPFKEEFNYTSGSVSLSSANSQTQILLRPGVYDIMFSYEFIPDQSVPGVQPPATCTVSSYFMDFPLSIKSGDKVIKSLVRLHSGSPHNTGKLSDHGGSFNFITQIFEDTTWDVKIGTGQAGNCAGAKGFALPNRSTFLFISRLGDVLDN